VAIPAAAQQNGKALKPTARKEGAVIWPDGRAAELRLDGGHRFDDRAAHRLACRQGVPKHLHRTCGLGRSATGAIGTLPDLALVSLARIQMEPFRHKNCNMVRASVACADLAALHFPQISV
jgi:hypothetical protein